ncbi:MAG TPA: Rrf2 family transcriptional regulator [Sedimentisphaerales bacterium]|nr:Rrf2 family transcriptional regulator [Sedimentisphaerales bacterium]
MKLSTRTRYAVRAIIELAQKGDNKPLQLKIIAQRQGISIKYLEQLMAVLRSGGFVRSVRGSKGGYVLAKAPDQIKLNDVLHCLEGPVATVECVDDEDCCTRSADCAARSLWMQVAQAIEKVLQSVTLQDLVDRANNGNKLDYQI